MRIAIDLEIRRCSFVQRVRLWHFVADSGGSDGYPFRCDTVIHTGHRANIFNAHMLPYSLRMYVSRFVTVYSILIATQNQSATVAGDNQVRVFDHVKAAGQPQDNGETHYYARHAAIRVLRCHDGRVKRIVTEDSPDLFLTVGEVCGRRLSGS